MKRTLIITILAALVFAGTAQAGGTEDVIARGYITTKVFSETDCPQVPANWFASYKLSAKGFGAEVDFGCANAPGFGAAVDAFLAGHDARKFGYENPEALPARDALVGKGYAVEVNYVAATLHVTGGCNIDETLTGQTVKAYADAAPVAAPCPPPAEAPAPAPPAEESIVVVEPTEGTVEERLSALEARYEELSNRVNAIQLANRAAWDTLVRLLGSGSPAYVAALGARSAGMNAMYGLEG